MPSYPSCPTRGFFIGGYFSESLLLLLIYFMEASSSSDFRKIYLMPWASPSSVSDVSTLILQTPDTLILRRIFFSRLALSILFSVARSTWSLDSSIVFPFFAIYLAL